MGRTRGAADDAPSAVSAKVAFVTDAHKGLGAYVGITDRAAWRLPSAQASKDGLRDAPFSVALLTQTADG